MILRRIRQKIGDILNGHSKKRSPRSHWNKLEAVKSVVIFSDLDSPRSTDVFNSFRKEIKQLCPKAEVTALLFVEESAKDVVSGISQGDRIYTNEKEFSVFFKFKNEDVINSLSKEYDLAINITNRQHIYLDYLFRYVLSSVKVGGQGADSENFNLIINSQKQTSEDFCKDISQSLKMIF